jgi:cyclopropane-fatty-acyl-phospholipid synthase
MFKTIFFSFFKNKRFKGILEIEFQGEKFQFGQELSEEEKQNKISFVKLKILDKNFFRRIIIFGDIGLGEAYINKEFTVSDLKSLFKWFLQNQELLPGFNDKNSKNRLFEWGKIFAQVKHLLNRNTIRGSKKNIHSHYDVSNDFYKLWLDETMTYSCALFRNSDDLKQAQINKYQAICAKAKLQNGDHVLEIGSGWGGFSIYATQNYNCRVTTITISEEQYDYVKKKIKELHLENKIEVVLKDYRDMEGEFDKIVSIEMMEALGHQYVPMFIDKCNELLKAGGKMVFQCITYPDEDSFSEYLRNNNYIKKYIFPGGELISLRRLKKTIANNNLNISFVESIGLHYAKTLNLWAKNLKAQKEKVLELGFDEKFYRKWYYYFVYCESGFETSYLDDVHIIIDKK